MPPPPLLGAACSRRRLGHRRLGRGRTAAAAYLLRLAPRLRLRLAPRSSSARASPPPPHDLPSPAPHAPPSPPLAADRAAASGAAASRRDRVAAAARRSSRTPPIRAHPFNLPRLTPRAARKLGLAPRLLPRRPVSPPMLRAASAAVRAPRCARPLTRISRAGRSGLLCVRIVRRRVPKARVRSDFPTFPQASPRGRLSCSRGCRSMSPAWHGSPVAAAFTRYLWHTSICTDCRPRSMPVQSQVLMMVFLPKPSPVILAKTTEAVAVRFRCNAWTARVEPHASEHPGLGIVRGAGFSCGAARSQATTASDECSSIADGLPGKREDVWLSADEAKRHSLERNRPLCRHRRSGVGALRSRFFRHQRTAREDGGARCAGGHRCAVNREFYECPASPPSASADR